MEPEENPKSPTGKKISIFTLLEKRYPENEFVLLQEVRDRAGGYASRSADFIAVNLWPSRGLAISGIELKSHRGDWLSELKKPEKAENIFQYCDYFWLLTTDENVAKLEEIPPAWGWMVVRGQKILIKKNAPKLKPKPLSKDFVCAMLKRAASKKGFIHEDAINQAIINAVDAAKHEKDRLFKNVTQERDMLLQILAAFKTSSGIDLREYGRFDSNGQKTANIGKIVAQVLANNGIESIKYQLRNLEKTTQSALDKITKTLEEIAEYEQPTQDSNSSGTAL